MIRSVLSAPDFCAKVGPGPLVQVGSAAQWMTSAS